MDEEKVFLIFSICIMRNQKYIMNQWSFVTPMIYPQCKAVVVVQIYQVLEAFQYLYVREAVGSLRNGT